MKLRSRIITVILVVMIIGGLGLMLYPTASDTVNRIENGSEIDRYRSRTAELSAAEIALYFEAADAYNHEILKYPRGFSDRLTVPGYDGIPDVTGMGMWGYVEVPKIGVLLPVYPGTDADTLETAIGHLPGTSIPAGGAGTHSCLSAHRGLPTARLFTDLPKLEIGDSFTVTVLDRTMIYEIDRIETVLPSVTEPLDLDPGQDYCTLMTCTPYGINSHRLMVRGKRVG